MASQDLANFDRTQVQHAIDVLVESIQVGVS